LPAAGSCPSPTLAEAIVEDPIIILRKQKDKARDEAMERMREEGLYFEDRIERIEEVEVPTPKKEFLLQTFAAFADAQPWVGDQKVMPKSIAREMYEDFLSFNDYVSRYALHRSEGLLLRHLSSVYKVLERTVPAPSKTPALREAIVYLESMIRSVDSSLIDEWTKLQLADPMLSTMKVERGGIGLARGAPAATANIADDPSQLRLELRILALELVRALATRNLEWIISRLKAISPNGQTDWTIDRLANALEHFRERPIDTGLAARAPEYTTLAEGPETWHLTQTILDLEHTGWTLELTLDMPATRLADRPRVRLIRFGPGPTTPLPSPADPSVAEPPSGTDSPVHAE